MGRIGKEFTTMNKKAEFINTSEKQNTTIGIIREAFSEMYDTVESNCKPSRETSLALTKLEEAQFWAIKGISRGKG